MGRTLRLLAMSCAMLATISGVAAQETPYRSSPERRTAPERDWGPWLGPFRQQLIPALMTDFGEAYLYVDANRRLGPPRIAERRVVFIGDSITDRWDLTRYFPGRPYVNRGIGSQVTAQMVVRFRQDVVALRPAVVVILAGVNDVHGVIQRPTPEQIRDNWTTMADLADRNGIRPIFASLLPVHDDTDAARGVMADHDPAELRALNDWLRGFCRRRGYIYADYWSVLVDDRGRLARRWSDDGIHPIAAGYARMAPVIAGAIKQALR